jgi:hypothetical protein
VNVLASEFGSALNVLGQRIGEADNYGTDYPLFLTTGYISVSGTADRLIASNGDLFIYVQPYPGP